MNRYISNAFSGLVPISRVTHRQGNSQPESDDFILGYAVDEGKLRRFFNKFIEFGQQNDVTFVDVLQPLEATDLANTVVIQKTRKQLPQNIATRVIVDPLEAVNALVCHNTTFDVKLYSVYAYAERSSWCLHRIDGRFRSQFESRRH
jgi:hypothetical protein